jgi:RNA recognition motif-containing protein
MDKHMASLFIGDLSFFCSEIHLAQLFSSYGKIAKIQVKRGKDGESLMHAFLQYESELSANLAMRHLNGAYFMGRKIR